MIGQQLVHVHEHMLFLKHSRVRVDMKRSVHALSASSSSDARQCLGTTLRGVRCSISSASKFAGKDGRDLALPLRRGCDYCLAHLPVLATEQTAWDASTDVLLFYLNFETSGLDIFADHIVEFGMLCESENVSRPFAIPPCSPPDRTFTELAMRSF